jgi:hypothetical protein
MSQIANSDALPHALLWRPDGNRIAPWLWGALLVAVSAIASGVFTCVTPFVAFAVIAALSFDLAGALVVTTGVWLANQAIGFLVLTYPWTGETALWGLAIGASSLLATIAAFQVLDSARRLGTPLAAVAALVVAYGVYEAGLFVAAVGLGGTDEFTAPVLGEVARLNALWLLGLGAAYQARHVLGGARVMAHR